MTAKERILALHLIEEANKHADYAKSIGIDCSITQPHKTKLRTVSSHDEASLPGIYTKQMRKKCTRLMATALTFSYRVKSKKWLLQ